MTEEMTRVEKAMYELAQALYEEAIELNVHPQDHREWNNVEDNITDAIDQLRA